MSPWQINRLGKALLQGAVFAYPTDTIWGFGCHPLRLDAVLQILDIKQRPLDKGLILLASELSQLEVYLSEDLNDRDRRRLASSTDYPTTWLVEAAPSCPLWLRGKFSTIAIRITDHPLVQKLCESIDSPLVSTSANRSGKPTIRNALQARRQFGGELDFIVEGFSTGRNSASRIKSLSSDQVIRTN